MAHKRGAEEMIEIVPDRKKEPDTLEGYLEQMEESEKRKLFEYLKEKEKTDE